MTTRRVAAGWLTVDDAARLAGLQHETAGQARAMMGQERGEIRELSGERRLALAVIEDALELAHTTDPTKIKLQAEAVEWIATPDDNPVFARSFSFDWCCDQVRLNAENLRELVFAALAGRRSFRSTNFAAMGDNRRRRRKAQIVQDERLGK